MTRRRWIRAFVAVFAVWLAMELWSSFDKDPDTVPFTWILVDHVSWELLLFVFGALALWLPPHFYIRYRRRARERARSTSARAGIYWVLLLAFAVAGCDYIRRLPDLIPGPPSPPPTTLAPAPSPSPEPSTAPPTPAPEPSSAPPSPAPSPVPCTAPQGGGEWVPDARFEDAPPEDWICDEVNAALLTLSGCPGPNTSCPLDPPERQRFFRERLIPELQRRGFCAGQHLDGQTDEVSITTPEEYPAGPWRNFHAFGNGKAVWCRPGMPNREGVPGRGSWRGRWRFVPDGSPIPEPEPPASPEPDPEPPPTPRPKPRIADRAYVSGVTTLKPGQSAGLECMFWLNGERVSPPIKDFSVGAMLGGPIRAWHFTVTQPGQYRRVLTLKPDCPAGTFKVYCNTVNPDGSYTTSPNLTIEVRP
ncbi:hypothetical protein [Longimicrobium sp.]|uniref:hypothetical protein n=1 Tax=Longimicrobium sp. TaxID=2029185 RepID=UPI002E3768EC|nr:hypothetical protein [Longimicrobium sp.]HEX6038898.1 hypothetical protein [Longimicrobium sp.]